MHHAVVDCLACTVNISKLAYLLFMTSEEVIWPSQIFTSSVNAKLVAVEIAPRALAAGLACLKVVKLSKVREMPIWD